MAQLVKQLILGFCSGHNFVAHDKEPHAGLHANSTEPAWDSLFSLSLPFPAQEHALHLSLSLSIKIIIIIKGINTEENHRRGEHNCQY